MDIVQIITAVAGYIATIVLFVKSLFDKKKSKDTEAFATGLENDNAKLQILNQVSEFCSEAEQIVGRGNGALKALYVTCKIEALANSAGVAISQEEISEAINSSLKSPQAKISEGKTYDN